MLDELVDILCKTFGYMNADFQRCPKEQLQTGIG